MSRTTGVDLGFTTLHLIATSETVRTISFDATFYEPPVTAVNLIRLGSTAPDMMMLGSTEVVAAYLGSTQVYGP
jgi:hypothetical protein